MHTLQASVVFINFVDTAFRIIKAESIFRVPVRCVPVNPKKLGAGSFKDAAQQRVDPLKVRIADSWKIESSFCLKKSLPAYC